MKKKAQQVLLLSAGVIGTASLIASEINAA